MENLWPSFDEETIESNEAIQILREQARIIQSSTKSKVRATFSKMSYKAGPLSAVEQLGRVVTAMSSPVYEEILDEELKEKTDVNTLFYTTQYKFEIYNDEYRFRLFVLNNSEMFPITLDVDGGILEDIGYQNKSRIESNEELKSILKDIFSCRKVQKVVAKMLAK